MAYFRSDIYIIVFFLWDGMKTSGSAGLFNKKNKKIYLVGSPKVGGAGRWETQKMSTLFSFPSKNQINAQGAATENPGTCGRPIYNLAISNDYNIGRYVLFG